MSDPIKTTASKALSGETLQPSEVKSLAASVLASKPAQTSKSLADLQRMMRLSQSTPGYAERAEAIQRRMDNESVSS